MRKHKSFHKLSVGNMPFFQKKSGYLFKQKHMDYFSKAALLLFSLCACLWEPMYTCFVFLYATQSWDAGLFKKASDEAQRSNPPAFMLGWRRELNTEGLGWWAGCSEECWGLAKLTAKLWRAKALKHQSAAGHRLSAYRKDCFTCIMLFTPALVALLGQMSAFIELLMGLNCQR